MFALSLLSLVLASAPADDPPDAVALIGRLGSESFDDRVAAWKELERLGRSALPALRAAANDSDMRVRSRVRALIETIGHQVEAEQFERPTMIRLDFRTRPLAQIVDDLNDRYDLGLSLRLGPEPQRGLMGFDPDAPDRLKGLREREVKLRAARPLPFWEAIDRLCEDGGLHYGISSLQRRADGRGALLLMADRAGRDPVSDSGPYRVQVLGHLPVLAPEFRFRVVRAGRGPRPPAVGNLTVPLAVLAEPGLMLRRNGEVTVTEAIDDGGRSLVPEAPAEPAPGPVDPADKFLRTLYEGDAIAVDAVLVAPDPPAKALRRLRGKVPVVAVARGADPLVLSLKGEGVPGRSFSTRDLTIIIEEVSLNPGTPASVTVTVRENRGNRATFPRHDPPGAFGAAFNRGGVLAHLSLHDATGRRLDHQLGLQMRGADTEGFYDRYQFIVAPLPANGPVEGPGAARDRIPTELRYDRFVEKAMEIPFDFRDVHLH